MKFETPTPDNKKNTTLKRTAIASALLATSACSENPDTNNSSEKLEDTHKVTMEERAEARRAFRAEKRSQENEKYTRIEQRAEQLAKQMGLALEKKFTYVTEGNIPTQINGHDVPTRLFTDKERAGIAFIRNASNMLDSDSSTSSSNEYPPTQTTPHSKPIESKPVDTSHY